MATNQRRRFTREDFAEIRRLKYDLGWPQKRIAQHYQVSNAAISKVLDMGYDEYYPTRIKTFSYNSVLTAEMVIEMRELRRNTGKSYAGIGEIYDVHPSTAYAAVTGQTWPEVPGAIREAA